MKGAPRGVMVVTDRHAALGRPLVEVVRAALEGGATHVQLREKDLPGRDLLRLAAEIAAAARAAGATRLLVNDRLDVALAAHAAGVHLPAAGLPVDAVRRQVGARFLVGRSVHSLAEARAAAKAGASYVLLGPVFETASKAGYGPPLGIDVLAEAARAVSVPVWAIGGITPENAAALRDLPIAGVAAITAIVAAGDPARATARLREALAPPR